MVAVPAATPLLPVRLLHCRLWCACAALPVKTSSSPGSLISRATLALSPYAYYQKLQVEKRGGM